VRGSAYVVGYWQDAAGPTSRERAAEILAAPRIGTVALANDPAPYNMPPVNLFEKKLIVLPRGFKMRHVPAEVDAVIYPIDFPISGKPIGGGWKKIEVGLGHPLLRTPFSWADKSFVIYVRYWLAP